MTTVQMDDGSLFNQGQNAALQRIQMRLGGSGPATYASVHKQIDELRRRAAAAGEAALACHKACLDEAHEFLDDAKKRITLAEQQRDAAVEGLEAALRLRDIDATEQECDEAEKLIRDTLARIRELGEGEGR